MSFAENLKNAINNAGITQSELARKTGINKAIISEYLSGKYEAKQQNTYKLAKALNIKPSELMSSCIDELNSNTCLSPTLSDHDRNLVDAYHAAPANAKQVVDLTLEPYMPVLKEKGETAV